tara:strand:- start:4541 stop:5092 length:552 start_codon:yes stop_codon:yes gene_type:complete
MDNLQLISLLVGMITLSRIVHQMSGQINSLCKATTFSNTLTFLALLSIIVKNEKYLVRSSSAVAFAMMLAFWTVYLMYGKKSLYGRYNASYYEIYVDHLFIPLFMIFISLFYKDDNQSLKRTILQIIIIETFWLFCTLTTDPVYPFLKNSDGTLNAFKLLMMTTVFGAISIGFETVHHHIRNK